MTIDIAAVEAASAVVIVVRHHATSMGDWLLIQDLRRNQKARNAEVSRTVCMKKSDHVHPKGTTVN